MPLTLSIRNADYLENGSPLHLTLDQRGATIGRAATCDWCLPDPVRHISSRHCEIRFSNNCYELNDISTNGTFLLGQSARLPGPHVLSQGDILIVGPFEIEVALDDASAAAASSANAEPQLAKWKSWTDATQGNQSAPAVSDSKWDSRPSGPAIAGTGSMSENWAPPAATAPLPAPAPLGWGPAAQEPADNSAGWGPAPASASPPSPPAPAWGNDAPADPAPAPQGGGNVWDQFTSSNQVDWARGGFGSANAPVPSPPAPAPVAAHPPAATPPAPGPIGDHASQSPPLPHNGQAIAALLGAAGLDGARLTGTEEETMAAAGDMLRRLVAGLVIMLEARARAKSQMGAQGTSLELNGNNPLKFVRAPEEALLKLLNPAERGFMGGDDAVEDAYKDLQAHQMATLKAMQGALRATLDRFSPTAIRNRAEDAGLLGKILPGARDAALWKAYEKEFGGVARGSDEAFMDVFAKEFRKAYEEQSR